MENHIYPPPNYHGFGVKQGNLLCLVDEKILGAIPKNSQSRWALAYNIALFVDHSPNHNQSGRHSLYGLKLEPPIGSESFACSAKTVATESVLSGV